MEPYVYIYIFEDGEARQTQKVPSDEDLLSIDGGILQIIYVTGGQAMDVLPDGTFEHLPRVTPGE